MKTKMEDIDKLIKDTLTEEEAKFYDGLHPQGLVGMIRGLTQGKLKWIIILMNVVHLLVVIALVYCIVQFFNTDDTNELIKWSSGGFICLIFGGMIKIFVWQQIHKNELVREIKRLELQVSSLSSKFSD